MPIELMPLPYARNALEPHISAETLDYHHGKHHRAYVTKLNELIADGPMAGLPLNDIVIQSHKKKDEKVFRQAAQAWNHGFYWHSLSPDRTKPDAALAKAIAADFGSVDALTAQLADKAVGHFASGWAWLVADGDKLSVVDSHDAETPLTGKARPLLTIDVWEHAYYIDRRNDRKAYVEAVISDLLNWNFASENFARAAAWTYPG